jgi:hypothetical protein
LNVVNSFSWTLSPFLVATVTFATYIFIDDNNVLDANKAFVSLTLFNILKAPLTLLPNTISNIIQATVSLKRIQNFLLLDEINRNDVSHELIDNIGIRLKNVNLSWNEASNSESNDKITLKE